MSNQPEVGDRISYYGRHDNVVTGILAERAISPLTGNPRYRVVDCWAEVKDPDAGRWVGIEETIRIDPPAPPPQYPEHTCAGMYDLTCEACALEEGDNQPGPEDSNPGPGSFYEPEEWDVAGGL